MNPTAAPTAIPTMRPFPLPTSEPTAGPTNHPTATPVPHQLIFQLKPQHLPQVSCHRSTDPVSYSVLRCVGTEGVSVKNGTGYGLFQLYLFDSAGDGWNGVTSLRETEGEGSWATVASGTVSTGRSSSRLVLACKPAYNFSSTQMETR